MLQMTITYKFESQIGNGLISASSKSIYDISPKLNDWLAYGDEQLEKIWATQILKMTHKEAFRIIKVSTKVV